MRELQSIVDYGRSNPAIDPVLGAVTFFDFYWSSTSYASSPREGAWSVCFNDGGVDFTNGFFIDVEIVVGLLVRAVRNAP